jgi:hypothetical protein
MTPDKGKGTQEATALRLPRVCLRRLSTYPECQTLPVVCRNLNLLLRSEIRLFFERDNPDGTGIHFLSQLLHRMSKATTNTSFNKLSGFLLQLNELKHTVHIK